MPVAVASPIPLPRHAVEQVPSYLSLDASGCRLFDLLPRHALRQVPSHFFSFVPVAVASSISRPRHAIEKRIP